MYSNIHSRAGLVALVFALIISVVSAAPLGVSGDMARHGGGFPRRASGKGHLHNHSGRFARPVAPAPITGDGDNQLAPRGIDIKKAVVKTLSGYKGNNGRVLAKTALKGTGTYVAAASKIVSYFPGIGPRLAPTYTAVSSSLHNIGNSIDANVGRRPQKALDMLDGLTKKMVGTPNRREGLQQREEYLEERDAYLEERDANLELEERDIYAFDDALDLE